MVYPIIILKSPSINFSFIIFIFDKMCIRDRTNGFKLVIGLILLYIGWKIINKVIRILANIMKNRNVDPTLTSFAEAFSEVSLKVLLVITLMLSLIHI